MGPPGPAGPQGEPGPAGPPGESATAAGGGFLPYYIPEGTTFAIPEFCQAPAVMDVVVDGALVLGGYLVELS